MFTAKQIIKSIFIATFFIICVLNVYAQDTKSPSKTSSSTPSSSKSAEEKNKEIEAPFTQPLSMEGIKNLLKSDTFPPNERFNNILRLLADRKIDFDMTPEIEIVLGRYLLSEKFDIAQVVRLIERLKFINAEDRFLRLEGAFLTNLKKETNDSQATELLELANELAELFLSSESPKSVGKVYNLRGNIYFRQKNYDKAIYELKKAVNVGFKGRATNQLLGQCYDAKGDTEKQDSTLVDVYFRSAIKYFSEAIRLDPNNEILYEYRGRVFQKLGNKEQAEENFKKYNELKKAKEY